MAKIAATLDEQSGTRASRRRRFGRLQKRLASSGDATRKQMGRVMAAFAVGLFAGGNLRGLPVDNLDLERWFRLPKGHERRINGRRHAGVRLVQEGATLMPVLDAHREGVFTAELLLGYRDAKPPADEQEAIQRRKLMRKARSKKKRPALLAALEQQYLNAN